MKHWCSCSQALCKFEFGSNGSWHGSRTLPISRLLCSVWKWLPIFFISHSKYYIAVPSIHPPNPYLTSSDLVNHTDFLFIENWLIQKVAISVQWWVEPKKRFSKSESEPGWRLASTQNFKPYKKWTPLSMRQKSVLDKTTFWNQMRMM